MIHFMAVPFTGLGLFSGYRGSRWLRNRVKIFEQFVVPSLLNQVNKNFTVWVSWRPEEKNNKIVVSFIARLSKINELKFIHTFTGCPIWDDKYKGDEARERLLNALHGAMATLINYVGETDYVYMTIQPSDDLYDKYTVQNIQAIFANTDLEAVGFKQGYICNYQTKEVCEYNPTTNPPFYTIKFPRKIFTDPFPHAQYTALKVDVGEYKVGTPCPSHEYIGDCLKYGTFDVRGFLVGCHLDNISTVFNHPFKGAPVENVLDKFGIEDVPPLKISYGLRKRLLRLLPFKWQRKIRYIFGERGWQKIYDWLRN